MIYQSERDSWNIWDTMRKESLENSQDKIPGKGTSDEHFEQMDRGIITPKKKN